MGCWIQAIRHTSLQLIRFGPASIALLLALLSPDISPVNAGGFSNGIAERVVRIGVTSRNGTRRVFFVRQGNRSLSGNLQTHVSTSNCRESNVAGPQLERSWILAFERERFFVPLAVPGAKQCSWDPAANVGQAESEPTVHISPDFIPAVQAEGDEVPQFAVLSEPEHAPRSVFVPVDATRSPQMAAEHARRTEPQAEAEHSENIETSRGSSVSADARLALAETTDLRLQSGFIVVGLVLCILLLLLVVMLLLRRPSVPLHSTGHVEMSHAPTLHQCLPVATDSANGQLPVEGIGATHQQERKTKVCETVAKETGMWERIVEDNVVLCEKLAVSAA